MALPKKLLCVEVLFWNMDAPSETDPEVEGRAGEVGDPHSEQNRVPGTNGLPHIMQNAFILTSS